MVLHPGQRQARCEGPPTHLLPGAAPRDAPQGEAPWPGSSPAGAMPLWQFTALEWLPKTSVEATLLPFLLLFATVTAVYVDCKHKVDMVSRNRKIN